MNRRRFLRAAGSTLPVPLAGCLGGVPRDSPSSGGSDWPTAGYDAGNTSFRPEGGGPGADADIEWRASLGTPTGYASPTVVDGTVYAIGTGNPGGIRAFDAGSGERRWHYDTSAWATGAPTVADGTLYVGGWGGFVYAVDAADGTEVWTTEIGHYVGGSAPTVVDGTVYVGTNGHGPLVSSGDDSEEFDACAVVALDADSGEEVWRHADFGPKENIDGTPAVADGRVLVGADKSGVTAVDASNGERLWQAEVGRVLAAPATRDGTVYAAVHGSKRVVALDAETGERAWTTPVPGSNKKGSPAVTEDAVYVPGTRLVGCVDDCDDPPPSLGFLHALDPDTGEVRWTHETKPGTHSSPAVVGDRIYVAAGGAVECVTTAGERVFRAALPESNVQSSPAVGRGRVFVDGPEGRLFAVS